MTINFDEDKQKIQLAGLYKEEEEELVETLANTKYNLPYIDLSKIGIDNESLRYISEEESKKLNIGPFKLVGKNIYIGIHSPNEDLMKNIEENMKAKNMKAVFYMVSLASLNKVWERYRELSMAESSKVGGIEISAEVLQEKIKNINHLKDIEKMITEVISENKVHRISSILEIILAGAISVGASDVHLELEEKRSRLRIRLDGVLQDVAFFNTNIYHLLNSRIKLLSGVKLTSTIAQDGRFSIQEGDQEINIRTSLVPGAYGESIVMRILDPKTIQLNLEDIGMEPALFKIIQEEIDKPNGLILVTGPTGSGKTTTLYAFLRKIYSPEIKIITIEDPIEYHLIGITQTQINLEKGYNFPEGLRSSLRQDPDVIMVGEIRDAETTKIAIESALTGHLVFSTLHTNNAAGVIPRLIDLGANPKIMVSALSLSIAQRLVRKLCPLCKKEKKPSEKEALLIKRVLDTIKEENKNIEDYSLDLSQEFKLYEPVGCEKCNHTGFKGRIGVFEAIKTDESIEKIIPENPSEREIKKIARAQGILSMRQDGIIKALTGITSIDEIQSVVDLYEE
jgi:type II secretory ATPase GspE/PulE/Tfp pilus assembly ATPase PilB-like protein